MADRVNSVVPAPRIIALGGAVGRRAERTLKRTTLGPVRRRAIASLPSGLRPAARWIAGDAATGDERRLASAVEAIRARIASADGSIASYHSPMPGTFAIGGTGAALPGPLVAHRAGSHAKTGSAPRKGIALHRLACGLSAGRILELGTNTGMSASYFVTAPSCDLLVTIEGSAALAEVARQTISTFSDRFEVRAQLFDDALAGLKGAEPFDLAFIDGQHEGEATLHYEGRVRPLMDPHAGVVLFDDIYWSHDMNEAWRSVVESGRYELTLDLGVVGVAMLGPGPRRHVDLVRYLGRPHIPRRLSDAAPR